MTLKSHRYWKDGWPGTPRGAVPKKLLWRPVAASPTPGTRWHASRQQED